MRSQTKVAPEMDVPVADTGGTANDTHRTTLPATPQGTGLTLLVRTGQVTQATPTSPGSPPNWTPSPNAAGTMLDHTVIVYRGDNGEEHPSTATEWPVLLIGGGALGLQTQ